MPRPITEFMSSSQRYLLYGFTIITTVYVSLSLAFFLNSLDARAISMLIILIVALFSVVIVFHSTNSWIPILIILQLVRDVNFGSLIGEGTLKIGDICIFYVFSLWFIREVAIRGSARFIKSKLDLCIILFIFLCVLSLLWSTDIDLGLLRVTKLVRNFMFYIILRELFIKDFLGSYEKATKYYILTGIVLMCVYMGVILLFGGLSDFLSFSQKDTLTSQDLGSLRVRETGGGFLISGPAMWLFITSTLIFGSLMLSSNRLVKILKILLIIIFALGAILTLQRSLLVMVLIMFIFLLAGSMYLKSKRNIIFISTILIIFTVMGSVLGFVNIFQKRFDNAFEDGSWTQRTEFYTAAIDAFKQSPFLGIGVGSNYSWQAAYPEIGGNRSRIVHSAYLLALSELGMLGIVIFLFIIYFWIRYLWDCIRNINCTPYLRSICMTLFAFSAGYLVYITQVGEFEEFEPWLVMAIASAVKILSMPAVGLAKAPLVSRSADVC